VHGHLVQVLGQIAHARDHPPGLHLGSRDVLVRDRAPQCRQRGALRRVGHDDEAPPLPVAARRRLLRERQARLEDRTFHRPRQVQAMPDRTRGGEQFVRCEL
jgi:hypothetical protein